jgi:hypothetical protein
MPHLSAIVNHNRKKIKEKVRQKDGPENRNIYYSVFAIAVKQRCLASPRRGYTKKPAAKAARYHLLPFF